MKVWVTTVGTSPFALINSIWAACIEEDWCADKVYLVASEYTKCYIDDLTRIIERVIYCHNGRKAEFESIVVDDTDLKKVLETFVSIVSREKAEGNEVAVDITPGRKYMSAFSMYSGLVSSPRADKIFYLHLLDNRFLNRPYPMIPATHIYLEDIISIGGYE